MEIINFPPPTITPTRSTSTVEDGDVGQNGSFYSRNRKTPKKNQDQNVDEISPPLEGSSSLIDVLV